MVTIAAIASATAAGLAGCGATPRKAPTISVITSLYPLAQAVAAIGGSAVTVVDLTTAGVNPRAEAPTTGQLEEIRMASVIVAVGGGFQPALEQAIGTGPRVVTLAPRFGPGGEGAWLDPLSMKAFAPIIARALSAANPRAADRYANGALDFAEQMKSEAINFESELGGCTHRDIAAPDATLGALTREYHLNLHPLGTAPAPSAADVAGAATTVASSMSQVFAQPWVDNTTVKAAAARSGARIRNFDTLEAPPAGGWRRPSSYLSLLATGRATLTSALACGAGGIS